MPKVREECHGFVFLQLLFPELASEDREDGTGSDTISAVLYRFTVHQRAPAEVDVGLIGFKYL